MQIVKRAMWHVQSYGRVFSNRSCPQVACNFVYKVVRTTPPIHPQWTIMNLLRLVHLQQQGVYIHECQFAVRLWVPLMHVQKCTMQFWINKREFTSKWSHFCALHFNISKWVYELTWGVKVKNEKLIWGLSLKRCASTTNLMHAANAIEIQHSAWMFG